MKTAGLIQVMVMCAVASSATGCATNRAKTLLLMGGVGVVAAGAAYVMTPQDERPEMHALYGGAIGAAAAGVAGLFIFDEQKRSEELDRQATVMRRELEAFRDEGGGSHEPRLLYETSAPFGKDIPGEYRALVRPGHWSVYRLNQWVSQGEGAMIHQDRMVKLVPPQLNPKVQSQQNNSSEGVGTSRSDAGDASSARKPADDPKEKRGNES